MKTHLLRQRAALKTLDAEAPHVPPAGGAGLAALPRGFHSSPSFISCNAPTTGIP